MGHVVLAGAAAIAALAIPAAPASAQLAGNIAVGAGSGNGITVHRGGGGDRYKGGRHRGYGGVVVVGGPWLAGEGWAMDNNRSWEPDSFNDWWHDRPDRAYPRWVQENQNCDRMWWGGGVWRCSW